MKRVLIALFFALVLFCATGGLERFASDMEKQEPEVSQDID
ncbi:hypothetical protein J2Y03_004674 [Neobacillus niacini]|nr:hypothetical protein [Neobacillus niacini]MDR7079616.1 hypothetical protein [Neobacillus niacini]